MMIGTTAAGWREIRLMRCPYCGHQTHTRSIGAFHCGPHRNSDGSYSPAVQMREVQPEREAMGLLHPLPTEGRGHG